MRIYLLLLSLIFGLAACTPNTTRTYTDFYQAHPNKKRYSSLYKALQEKNKVQVLELGKLPSSTPLTQFTNLQTLNLRLTPQGNAPLELPPLPPIKELSISLLSNSQSYSNLLEEVEQLHQLEGLQLLCYPLVLKEGQLQALTKLQRLSLGTVSMPLPASIYQLSNLQKLNLRGSLDQLSEKLGQLQQLTTLCIQGDPVFSSPAPTLPQALTQLKKLQHLSITQQNLQQLPPHFEQLQHLKELHLNQNAFAEFPKALLALKKLQQLHLSYCQLKAIPKEIAQLSQLKYLDVRGNRLSKEQLLTLRELLPHCEIVFGE